MTSMHPHPDESGSKPHWTLSGLFLGARYAMPLIPGTAIFATGFGTLAAQKGLNIFEATLMSAFVFSGVAQFSAMEVWQTPLTGSVLFALFAVTGVIGLRLLLMGASLRPWLGTLPPWQTYPTLLLTTDASWLIAIRHRNEGGSDVAVLLGSGLALWIAWVATTAIGYVIGAAIADPARYGLDLTLAVFFVTMLVPLWKGARPAIPWVVAGAVALAVERIVPGYWYIIAGALAGSITGGFIHERR